MQSGREKKRMKLESKRFNSTLRTLVGYQWALSKHRKDRNVGFRVIEMIFELELFQRDDLRGASYLR